MHAQKQYAYKHIKYLHTISDISLYVKHLYHVQVVDNPIRPNIYIMYS